MGYYGFLDRARSGATKETRPPIWLRRHDEYRETDAPGR